MPQDSLKQRITLRDLRRWAGGGEKFAMLTCYDATTARWLWRGGVHTILVGDTAAQMILGHDSTLPIKMEFMLQITAAVRRGAPGALIMADMPFGSYQCGDDQAVANAAAFLAEGQADLVKLEITDSFAPLVRRMTDAGIPVVAHLGSRPQTVRATGGYQSTGKTQHGADNIVACAQRMIEAGAAALLLEAVPDVVSRRVVEAGSKANAGRVVVVIGCGAGPSCHGHVVVLHDLLGLSDWQPPFAPAQAELGGQIRDTAAQWVEMVQAGEYLADGGPYRMK